MSAPWFLGVPDAPPVEMTFGFENVAPPSVDELNMIGELPEAPWKSVWATYTLPAHGLSDVSFWSTSNHSLSVKVPTKPAAPGTAKPTEPRSTTVVPAYVKLGGFAAELGVLTPPGEPGV